MKKLKWFIILIILVGGGAGGFWYWRHRANELPEYQTADVTRGDLTQVVTASGQINPVINVQVGSQISGTIEKLYADFNSEVTNGQVIAQIDPSTYKANVMQAQGDLASAKAGLTLARVNANRSKELFEAKLIPQSDYDQAFATLQQAEATVMLKEATLERTRTDLERCTITSPVNGVVISRNVDVGQTVAASLSAPTLFVIANDLAKMQIDASVAEADIGGVDVGQIVDFTVDAFPYRTFHGKVVQIRNSPTNTQNVVSYDTVISASNPDLKLRPGMTANVSIVIARRDNAVRIPNAALRFRPADAGTNTPPQEANAGPKPGGGPGKHPKGERKPQRTIYVLKDDKPQPVQIKTGITDGVFTEVTDGLSETNQVITAAIIKSGKGATAPNPFGGGMRFR